MKDQPAAKLSARTRSQQVLFNHLLNVVLVNVNVACLDRVMNGVPALSNRECASGSASEHRDRRVMHLAGPAFLLWSYDFFRTSLAFVPTST